MKFLAVTAVALASVVPSAFAWGTLGHNTIAYVAQDFVSSSTRAFAQAVLNDTSSSYLANIATWADSYRTTAAGKFSAPYHYIDANDSPPSTCNVDFNRDCGAGGCVVSAISNYTQRLGDGRYSDANHKQALEFLVHFLGDVTQPLHDEAYQTGGNGVSVTFDGKSTNLHHIWDTEMPEKLRGGNTLTYARSWATDLSNSIKSGSYSSQKSSWLDGTDINDTQGSGLAWATDANKYVCSNALRNYSGDLGGQYYQDNIGIVQLQVAKAGYRLAAWLNLIHDGNTGGL